MSSVEMAASVMIAPPSWERACFVGMEFKATGAPTTSDARHLVGPRDRLAATLLAGILFHTAPRAFPLAERVTAVPISALWASAARA